MQIKQTFNVYYSCKVIGHTNLDYFFRAKFWDTRQIDVT